MSRKWTANRRRLFIEKGGGGGRFAKVNIDDVAGLAPQRGDRVWIEQGVGNDVNGAFMKDGPGKLSLSPLIFMQMVLLLLSSANPPSPPLLQSLFPKNELVSTLESPPPLLRPLLPMGPLCLPRKGREGKEEPLLHGREAEGLVS